MRSRMSLELESRWWTLGGAEVLDMMSSIGALVRAGQTVHIGTDAQKSATRMEFVTVACVLNPGKGGRVFYTRRFDRKEMRVRQAEATLRVLLDEPGEWYFDRPAHTCSTTNPVPARR